MILQKKIDINIRMYGICLKNYYKDFYFSLIKSNFKFLNTHISAIKVGNNLFQLM